MAWQVVLPLLLLINKWGQMRQRADWMEGWLDGWIWVFLFLWVIYTLWELKYVILVILLFSNTFLQSKLSHGHLCKETSGNLVPNTDCRHFAIQPAELSPSPVSITVQMEWWNTKLRSCKMTWKHGFQYSSLTLVTLSAKCIMSEVTANVLVNTIGAKKYTSSYLNLSTPHPFAASCL